MFFIAASRISLVVASGVSLHCGVRASNRGSFSCCGAQGLGHVGFSSCSLRALEHRLSSCGAWASLLRGMWDLPSLRIGPVSPALAGGSSTTREASMVFLIEQPELTETLTHLRCEFLFFPSSCPECIQTVLLLNPQDSWIHSCMIQLK